MTYGRTGHGAVELNGLFYVFGGNDGNKKHRQVEKLNYEEDEWIQLASMNCQRFGNHF